MSRPRIIRIVNVSFLALAFVALTWYLVTRWSDISRIVSASDGTILVAAFLVLVAYQFAQGSLIADLLISFGARAGRVETIRIILLSLLGKYVPGKIWIFTMRATFFAERNVPMKTVLTAAALEHIFVIVTAVSLFLAAAPPDKGFSPSLYRATGIALFLVLVLAPGFLVALANRALTLIGRAPIEQRITRRRSLSFSFRFLLTWLLLGAGVWLLSRSMGLAVPWTSWPFLAGSYAFSVAAGFLAFFAPGGIGVREGIFALALGRFIPATEAVFIALAVRLVTSLAELAALGAIWLIPARREGSKGD